mgnify:FL=1
MKCCSICNQTKPFESFYSHYKSKKDSEENKLYYFPYCKECNSQKKRNKDRTRDGIAHTLYTSQIRHSKHRGYPAPTYSETDLLKWLHSQPLFESLFIAWEESGFDSNLKPSCNRLDDYAGYSLTNIELVTWQGNREAWANDCVSGKNQKISRPVRQLDRQSNLIKEFFSIQEASRQVKVPHANIVKCCTGERETAGGFRWQYVNPGIAPKHTGFVGRA